MGIFEKLKPSHKILIEIFVIILFFSGYHFVEVYLKKVECLNINGKVTTLRELIDINNNVLTKNYIQYDTYDGVYTSKQEFQKIVFESKILGLDSNNDLPDFLDDSCFFSCNLSGGESWVQKMSSPTRPTLFAYSLYDYNDKIIILVSYSINSKDKKSELKFQTHDYLAYYEFMDIDKKRLIELALDIR